MSDTTCSFLDCTYCGEPVWQLRACRLVGLSWTVRFDCCLVGVEVHPFLSAIVCMAETLVVIKIIPLTPCLLFSCTGGLVDTDAADLRFICRLSWLSTQH